MFSEILLSLKGVHLPLSTVQSVSKEGNTVVTILIIKTSMYRFLAGWLAGARFRRVWPKLRGITHAQITSLYFWSGSEKHAFPKRTHHYPPWGSWLDYSLQSPIYSYYLHFCCCLLPLYASFPAELPTLGQAHCVTPSPRVIIPDPEI